MRRAALVRISKTMHYTTRGLMRGTACCGKATAPLTTSEAIRVTFFSSLAAYALCYLLVRLARPRFMMPERSEVLFELDWMPDHAPLVRAYADLFGKQPKPPLRDENEPV